MRSSETIIQCSAMIAGRKRCPEPATMACVRKERVRGGRWGEKRYPRCDKHQLAGSLLKFLPDPASSATGKSSDG